MSLQLLLRYKDDGDEFGQHIVADDKTRCHHFQPEAHQHAMVKSRLTYTLKIQSSAFSRKVDVDGLMGYGHFIVSGSLPDIACLLLTLLGYLHLPYSIVSFFFRHSGMNRPGTL
ncbi:hypothetical protein TNCV_3411251 [Trichonephila clavipes]|nr:hypothetical protein TNCV_3411251 [Trichonephila clavipes]